MKRSLSLIRLFFVVLLLSSAILVSFTRTSAQGEQPKYDPEVVKKAIDLLGKYGIPPTALDNLVGMLNNPEKLTETLKGFGLSEDNINSLYKEALPLIQEAGLDPSDIQHYVVDNARQFLADNGISEDKLDDFLKVQGDKEATEAFLKDAGIADDKLQEVENGMSFYEAMGLDKQTHAYILAQQGLDLVSKYGLKPTDLGDLLPLVNDPEKLAGALAGKGLDADKIQELLKEAAPLIQEGLQAGVMLDYVQQQAINILSGQGISPEQYQELLSKRDDANAFAEDLKSLGYSDEDITRIANEFSTLTDLGFDDKAAEESVKDLQQDEDSLKTELDPDDDGHINEEHLSDPESGHDTSGDESHDGSSDNNSGDQGNSNSGESTPTTP